MEEKKKRSFISWVKAHKKELTYAGISITAFVGIILGLKNEDALMKMWKELKDAIAKTKKAAEKVPKEKVIVPIQVEKAIEVTNPLKLVVADNVPIGKEPFGIKKHVRNLPFGYHPSLEKITTAPENGIELLPNQTWVKDYTKGLATVA